ncbi:MAG: alpha/beta hydrolase [Ruminococcaceae bacterium]|nr:alpha/beta hydrolase [Oscillospiraceae bacterium]
MISKRGWLVREFLYHIANLNPERVKSAIPGSKGLDVLFWKTPNREFAHYTKRTKNGTKYEVYYPKKGAHKDNCIYYLHGGAYIGKQNWIYRYQSRYYSNAADGATVVYVNYKTAPKHVYPAQLDAALDVWNEVILGELGFKAENVVCGGESAGGNLTLGLMLKLRDEGKPMPRGAFCMSAWTDMTASGQSYEENYLVDAMFGNRKATNLTEELRQKFLDFDVYCWTKGADRKCPYVSPVFGEYHGFPPMFFTVGTHEMLKSDTDTIVENLLKHGVDVTVHYGEGMWHVYTLWHGIVPEATESFKALCAFINKSFDYYGYVYPKKEYFLS